MIFVTGRLDLRKDVAQGAATGLGGAGPAAPNPPAKLGTSEAVHRPVSEAREQGRIPPISHLLSLRLAKRPGTGPIQRWRPPAPSVRRPQPETDLRHRPAAAPTTGPRSQYQFRIFIS